MIRADLIEFLKSRISEPRFNHCLGVEVMASKLAERFDVDPEKASIAALLHDVCREVSPDLLLKLAAKFDILISNIEQTEPILLHGFVGAAIVKQELNIIDPMILEAIAYHITGAAHISPLAQLIFIADFIEPGRQFERARILREEAFSLKPDQLLLKVYNYTINYVVNQGYLIHPLSIEGRNEIIMKGVN